MAVNADKTARWKADVLQSVDMYNDWFMVFAPKAYRDTRVRTAEDVENALKWTSNLTDIQPHLLRQYPAHGFVIQESVDNRLTFNHIF